MPLGSCLHFHHSGSAVVAVLLSPAHICPGQCFSIEAAVPSFVGLLATDNQTPLLLLLLLLRATYV
jgi:hypothetical protein